MGLKTMIRNIRTKNGYADPKEETPRSLDVMLLERGYAIRDTPDGRMIEKKDHGA